MKHVLYTDRQGYKQRRLIRDNDTEEDAQYGVPAGPPDLRQLDMGEILREANNALADFRNLDVERLTEIERQLDGSHERLQARTGKSIQRGSE